MPDDSPFGRLGGRFEALLFGERARAYRLFVRATFVLAAALALAYVAVQGGLVSLGADAASMLGVATAVAVAVLVVSGIVEFVVLGRVYQRGTTEVAQAAADLEHAAEQLEETAAELEETAEEVEGAAETVEGAAADIEETGAHVEEAAEVRDKTTGAKETADAAVEEAAEAKRTATAVEVTAEERRERLPGEHEDADGEREADDRDANRE
jgi:methyl-accepting chemotaxis protein